MSGARSQVQRLLALTPYLQVRGDVPVSTLAEEFGVTRGQILKDLNVLWYCGLPGPGNMVDLNMDALEADPDGAVHISNADFLPRPLRLTGSEAAALVVALRALREGSTADSRAVIDRVLSKLAESAGETVHAAVHLDREADDLHTTRRTLQAAIDRDRQLALDYYVPARDELTHRVVDPVSILHREDHDYLDAWCHLAEDRRLFRLDRIDRAEELGSARQSTDLAPRDLAAGLFEPSHTHQPAVLRLQPRARWVADYYPVEKAEEAPGGALDITMAVGDPRWLVRLVLSLAPDAAVLSPDHYAEAVTASGRATLALYERS